MQYAARAPTRCEPRDGHGAGQSAGRGGCTVSSSTRQDHASCSEAAQRAAGAWDALLEPFQHHAGVAAWTSSRSSQARRLKEHTTFERPARSTSDLHSRTQRSSARATRKAPRSGVGIDGRSMFLQFTARRGTMGATPCSYYYIVYKDYARRLDDATSSTTYYY